MSEVRFFSVWVVNYPIQEPFLSAHTKYESWIFPWCRKFHQGEVLVVQAVYDFLHAPKFLQNEKKITASMKKYLKSSKQKITFCRADKKSSSLFKESKIAVDFL